MSILHEQFGDGERMLGHKPRRRRLKAQKSLAPRGTPDHGGGGGGADSASPAEAVHAAIARLDEVRARLDRLDPAKSRPATVEKALDEETRAENELISEIRRASPDCGGGALAQTFAHRDGRLFVALPDGIDLEVQGRICRVLEIPTDCQGGVGSA